MTTNADKRAEKRRKASLRAFDRGLPSADSRGFLDRVDNRPTSADVQVTRPLQDVARQVLLTAIDPDPDQPRKNTDTEIEELAASITEHGVLEPIILYRPKGSERFRIIAGERRFRAAQLAGLEAIPALIRPDTYDESQKALQQVVENVQRVDLAPLEEARAYQAIMDTFELSQRDLAKRIGKPLSRINEHLAILRIDEALLAKPGAGSLGRHVLIEIAKADPPERPILLDRALSSESPLREVKEQRTNRKSKAPRERAVYFRETFSLDDQPPLEVRWKKHPDEVTADELAEALGKVVRQLAGRALE